MPRQFMAVAGLLAGLATTVSASADTLFGVYAGAGVWEQGYSGDAASGAQDVNLERDLDLKDQNNNVLYVAVEHGVPGLPNLRVNYVDVSTDGSNVLSRTVSFAGQQFTVSDSVATSLDLKLADAVAYYEVLDNVVSLDLGLAARAVDGRLEVASDTAIGRARFKGVLPMVYARTRIDVPFSGFWVGAEAMGMAYDHQQLVDANAQVGWASSIGLGAELGWRTFRLELHDIDQLDGAEIDVNGPYAALNFHF